MCASAHIVQIVESLLYSFVARRGGERFEDKDYGRMVRSFKALTQRLQAFEGPENRELDLLKYELGILVCKVFRDPTWPARPTWLPEGFPSLFGGYLRLVIFRAIARRDISFIYSLSQSKRAWPELGEFKKNASLQDHKDLIGGIPRQPIGWRFASEILATSKEVFCDLQKPTKMMPSASACLQAPRSKGGALSLFPKFEPPSTEDPGAAVIGYPRLFNLRLETWRRSTSKLALDNVRTKMLSARDQGLLDVKVEVIAEPGKFRTITKGDGFLYTAVQPAQGQLLAAWKRRRESTMKADIDQRVQRMQENLPSSWNWISVDYKSATDTLSKDASLLSIGEVKNLYNHELCIYSLLEGGRVIYPDGSEVVQKEGQLMGHPLSFPLLCVLNLTVYRYFVKKLLRKGLIDQYEAAAMVRHVLINGDDMLFRCPVGCERYFYPIAKKIGLVPSVGKSYCSPDCAMINSRVYRLVGGHMKRFGYLNLKILKGISVKDGLSNATPPQLSLALNEMMSLCPWTRGCLPMAFQRFGGAFRGFFQPNWYLPVHLGGYGIHPRFSPESLSITRTQRRVAALAVHDVKFQLFRKRGINLPLKGWDGFLGSWELAPSIIGHDHAGRDLKDDPWLARIAYAFQAAHGRLVHTSDRTVMYRLLKHQWAKPMSVNGIVRWWDAEVSAFPVPRLPGFVPVSELL